MLKKPANVRRPLFGLSGLFGLSRLFGWTRRTRATRWTRSTRQATLDEDGLFEHPVGSARVGQSIWTI